MNRFEALFCGQFDGKDSALSKSRAYTDLASMKTCEMLNYGQAQPGPADLAGPALIGPVKPLEDPRLMLGQDPLAGIGDF
jgi:hypothetical protein